jgi:2-dehydro-3-deoxyphosphooctonate aldolase (KDO 8-P synthase)
MIVFDGSKLVLICGPCVIESREHSLRHAEKIKGIADDCNLPLIFKSSYDKANRTAGDSFRGLGLDAGLEILAEVRRDIGVPVITDVHSPAEAKIVSEVVDFLQIPAFLCRQTDLLLAAAETKKPVMIKKGQFVAPEDMKFAVQKIESAGNKNAILCERGSCFGYRDLVVDFRGLSIMRSLGVPVVFDATHSVQIMGGAGGKSSGRREFVPMLARAAVAAGVDGIFIEAHEDPDKAPSDGPNMLSLELLPKLLGDLRLLVEANLQTRDV